MPMLQGGAIAGRGGVVGAIPFTSTTMRRDAIQPGATVRGGFVYGWTLQPHRVGGGAARWVGLACLGQRNAQRHRHIARRCAHSPRC